MFNSYNQLQDKGHSKKKNNDVRSLNSNLSRFFDSIDDMLFVLDTNGNILKVNKTVLDRLEYTHEELLGENILIVHPSDRREEAGKIVEEMLIGTEKSCPIPVITKNGKLIPVETRITPGEWDGKPALFGVSKDISELKVSEEKFSKIFHNHPAVMAISTFDEGILLDINRAFEQKLGYAKNEVIGKRSTELNLFVNEEDRLAVLKKMAKTGKTRDFEIEIRDKHGKIHIAMFSADTIGIQNNKFLLTVMIDITEKKEAERELIKQKEWLDTIFNTALTGIMIIDKQTHEIVEVNNSILEMVRADRSEVVGKKCHKFVCPAEEFCCPITDQNKKIINEERTLCRLDGSEIAIIKSVTDKKIGGKEYLIESIIDITGRKKAEIALQENEQKLKTIFEILPVGITISNMNGNIVSANESAVSILGLEKLPGKEEFIYPPNWRRIDRNYSAIEKAKFPEKIAKRENRIIVNSLIGLQKENDLITWLNISVAPLPLTNMGVVSIYFDVTKNINYEEELKKLNEEILENKSILEENQYNLQRIIEELEDSKGKLVEVNRTKDKFFSIIAHDLRAPFSGFLGISDLLSKEIDTLSISEIREMAVTLNKTSISTFNLLNDLLEWARLQTGSIKYHPAAVNVKELVKKSLNIMTNTLEQKNITLMEEIDPDLLAVCDINMIQTVIRNLYSNAIKFSRKGGEIFISAKNKNEFIEISVKDKGVGIPNEKLEDLFNIESDFSTLGTEAEKGSGLGLVLCREFVERNGGSILVESQFGQGSTFTFTLKSVL